MQDIMQDKNEKTYCLINYGCQMNESDTEHYAGQLEELGYKPVSDYHGADVILVNTCCVRGEYDMLPSGHALTHILHTMHLLASCSITPWALRRSAPVGQMAAQDASSHCMHMMGTVMAASS